MERDGAAPTARRHLGRGRLRGHEGHARLRRQRRRLRFSQASVQGFGTLSLNQRKPFFQKFGWSEFRYYGSDASNNYHGLQLKADKRFSKILGDESLHLVAVVQLRTPVTTLTRRRLTANDNTRSHVFFLSRIYELPFGKGKKYLGGANKVGDFIWAAGR